VGRWFPAVVEARSAAKPCESGTVCQIVWFGGRAKGAGRLHRVGYPAEPQQVVMLVGGGDSWYAFCYFFGAELNRREDH
jgi:hypothetical protein